MKQRIPSVVVRADLILRFVPEEYLIAIGRVITQWSILEEMLGAAIWQTASLRNDYGRIVGAQLQMMSKLDTLEALLRQRRPALGDQFGKIAAYVRDCLQGQRNLVAHGVWAADPTTTTVAVTKMGARGKLTDQGRTITIAELEALAADIADVTAWVILATHKLPELRQRPGGLGHTTPAPRNPQDCVARKSLVLQPPTSRRKLAAPKSPTSKASKRLRPAKTQLP